MTSFYSILKAPVRPAGQEYLNVGLLPVGEDESYFQFSHQKLELIEKLIPENAFNLLKSYLHGISKEINNAKGSSNAHFKNLGFVSYLSDYNNNLITFSKPPPIDLEANEVVYKTLFEKFVFTFEPEFTHI